MTKDIQHIIQENRRRVDFLFAPYDPIFGLGSLIPRFPFYFTTDQKKPVMIPEPMKGEEVIQDILASKLSAEEFAIVNGFEKEEEFLKMLNTLRMKYDFEFFAFISIKVEDKISKQPVPLRLRYAQRRIVAELERQRTLGIPIRLNIPKSRQFGSSTVCQAYLFWMQTVVKENWHSATIAHLDDAAKNLRGMYGFMARNFPKELGTITLKPYEASTKNKRVVETGSIVGVGSSETPDNLRGYSFGMLHQSEIAFFKTTPTKTPKDLAQSLASTVPLEKDTIIIRESTCKGLGYWYEVCMSSYNKTSKYALIFVPFFQIEIYHKEIDDYEKFINGMNEYDWLLWEKGASLESIKWYNDYKETEEYDDWRMKSEYPSDFLEAFQSSGNRVFPEKYVFQARKANKEPIWKGDVHADDISGPNALKNIELHPNDKGRLWIWAMPEKFGDIRFTNRYCVSLDIGGTSSEADYSVIRVMDRYWLSNEGIPEMVATWRGHIDQDLLAWKAVQICKIYDNGFFIPESNSLNSKTEHTEGNHFLTILDEIVEFYDNIYCRTNPEQIRQGLPKQYGFHTNKQTKTMIINTLKAALRDTEYFEPDARACDEMDMYEYKSDGSMGNVDGSHSHDDFVMSTAINVWCSIKHMPPVKEVNIASKRYSSRKAVGESSF